MGHPFFMPTRKTSLPSLLIVLYHRGVSHQSFTRLTAGGFSEEQTEALFEVYGDGYESLATKRDLESLATKDDLQALRTEMQAFATKDDLQRFATKDDLEGFARKDDLQAFATKVDLQGGLQSLELRLTLRFGALLVAGVAVLAALERL